MWLIAGSVYPIFGIAIPVFTWPMVLLVSLFTLACLFIGMLLLAGCTQPAKSNRITDGAGHAFLLTEWLHLAHRSHAAAHPAIFQLVTIDAFSASLSAHCHLPRNRERYSSAINGLNMDKHRLFFADGHLVAG